MSTNNQTGLLWQETDPNKPWRETVKLAAQRHQERLFLWPNCCYVHGLTVNPKLKIFNSGAFVEEIDGVRVFLHDGYQPGYFFVFHDRRAPVTEPAQLSSDPPSGQLITQAGQLALF